MIKLRFCEVKILKVTGNSMHPALESGAFVLVWHWKIGRYHQRLQVGDIVAVRHSYYGEIIKRVSEIQTDKHGRMIELCLRGDNAAASVTEEQMGRVALDQVIGKMVYVMGAKN